MNCILGKKIGMTTMYSEKKAHNVTLIECHSKVSFLRSMEKDKYEAVQIEIMKTKKRSCRREFKLDESAKDVKVGDVVEVGIFQAGDVVSVSGTSKAKGFQGVVKRHGFHGSPASHGHKHDHRKPGSIGSGFPEHVIKGKRMAGRMGGTRSTVKNLKVVMVEAEKKLIAVEGAVPGIPGSIVEIRKTK